MPEAAKPAAKRVAKPTAEPTAAPAPKPDPATPSPEAIAKRAYELYLQRGSVAGYELEDWLAAEAELIAAAVEADGD